ncbi:MAG: hypothetical protein FJ121_04240 [Deltaproteobacteria bacterium]|nr:hypothetical protein [Deltaproteobacteria bacterium]
MKTPLRYQASERDCGPTTFLNAITYLFDKKSIPPMAIDYIYRYTLDYAKCMGTSTYALEFLGEFFQENRLKTPKFTLSIDIIEGKEVHCGKDSKIYKRLKNSGVAICYFKKEDHFMLAMDIEDDYILLFDPLYRKSIRGLNENVIHLESDGFKPNLQIKRKWIDKESERFSFGPKNDRWCLLIKRDS